MQNNKFLQSLKSYIDKYQVKKQIKNSIKQSEKLRDTLCDFLNHTEVKLKYDHNKFSWDQWVDDFTEKNIITKKFKPNQNVTFSLANTHHYNDTWEKYNITKRFNKTYNFRIEQGSLLHLAAILGNKKMVEALVEAGADINKKDLNGYKPLDVLFRNDNYTTEQDFIAIKNTLSSKPALRLVK